MTMELIIRGKGIFGESQTKGEMIGCLHWVGSWIKDIPDDAKIYNKGDDYVIFSVEPKDKDDRKFLKSLGFRRQEVE